MPVGFPALYYIVGTVLDLEPKMGQELEIQGILKTFVSRGGENGVFLDRCLKLRFTRNIRPGKPFRWLIVQGTEVIGHQIEEQWRLWAREGASRYVPREEA